MELCTGGDLLTKCIEAGKPLTEQEAALQMDKCLRALQHCHELGIIHRNLKPQNMVFASEKPRAEIKVVDFGLSVFTPEEDNEQSEDDQGQAPDKLGAIGSRHYMAPEVLTGKYNEKSDIWSLGVSFYHLLLGKLPRAPKDKDGKKGAIVLELESSF